MWVSIHNTRAWLCRALRLAASRVLPRVLPGLEEAVRASWVYSQKVLVIYGSLTRFSSLYGPQLTEAHSRGAHTLRTRSQTRRAARGRATPLFPQCAQTVPQHTRTRCDVAARYIFLTRAFLFVHPIRFRTRPRRAAVRAARGAAGAGRGRARGAGAAPPTQ